ncbi:MAG: excinuclease ABC subunit UvrC [Nitrospirae bacterium]|nr:excinuclease ABC subunit UvrC [Nitrospirota bacterium]
MAVKQKLSIVPSSPGIYIMKGLRERPIYVGKAKNLRTRLRSYFQESSGLDARKSVMIREIRDFSYIVTANELEALVLEANFIKRFKPKYNIILRDDKNYPYLKLTVNEEWPRLEVVRRIARDGSIYFGPYVPTGIMWETLAFVRRNFPVRTCRHKLDRPMRPCVQYQMGRCLAPCTGDLSRDKYMEAVNEVKLFLQGQRKELLENLQKRMERLSDVLKFEEAANIRDRLRVIEKAWGEQRAVAPELGDMDAIGLYREKQEAVVFMLFIRKGMIIGQRDFFLKRLKDTGDDELLRSFIEQFYSKEILPPPAIILPVQAELHTQRLWLSEKRGGTVKLSIPKTEKEFNVLRMASDNAAIAFRRHKEERVDETLLELKNLLNLKALPERIEAIDVSNISGSEAVGALVVWKDRSFLKDDYRLFKIKTVEGIDDFAMIGEVAGRYFKKKLESVGGEDLPQLLVIDGGRGQLEAALRAMSVFGLSMDVIGLAKERKDRPERVYLPAKATPIPLAPGAASTHLLQRIRDEAHRFAITYHKKLRAKRTLESPLSKIPGIGKVRRLSLLKRFGSLDAIRKATMEELLEVKGIDKKIAEALVGGKK